MRAVSILGLLGLLGACVEPDPQVDLDETSEARAIAPTMELIPDGLAVPVPVPVPVPEQAPAVAKKRPAPRLIVVEPEEIEDQEACYFEVVEIGLPAVRNDGEMVAYVELDPAGGADYWFGGSDFVTHDFSDIEGSDRRRLMDDAMDRGPVDGATVSSCAKYERRLRRRVKAFNQELKEYRALEELDVVVYDTNRLGEQDPSEILPARQVPAADRPVQAMYRAGWFTLRVPGLKVLSQQAMAHWRVADDFCDTEPHLNVLWGDRSSGVGLVTLDHASGACLCDDGSSFEPILVPPAVFAELDQRPSEAYLERVDAACEAQAVC